MVRSRKSKQEDKAECTTPGAFNQENQFQLTCAEPRLIGCVATVVVVIAELRCWDAIVIRTCKLTNWTLLAGSVDDRILWLRRLLSAVNRIGGVAQAKHHDIDFAGNHHFWFSLCFGFVGELLSSAASYLRVLQLLYCFEHVCPYVIDHYSLTCTIDRSQDEFLWRIFCTSLLHYHYSAFWQSSLPDLRSLQPLTSRTDNNLLFGLSGKNKKLCYWGFAIVFGDFFFLLPLVFLLIYVCQECEERSNNAPKKFRLFVKFAPSRRVSRGKAPEKIFLRWLNFTRVEIDWNVICSTDFLSNWIIFRDFRSAELYFYLASVKADSL